MDFQHWFEVLASALGLIGGWFLRTLWQDTKTLAVKVQAIELLVAGQYVSKSEFEKAISTISNTLNRIEDKLDRKVDK